MSNENKWIFFGSFCHYNIFKQVALRNNFVTWDYKIWKFSVPHPNSCLNRMTHTAKVGLPMRSFPKEVSNLAWHPRVSLSCSRKIECHREYSVCIYVYVYVYMYV